MPIVSNSVVVDRTLFACEEKVDDLCRQQLRVIDFRSQALEVLKDQIGFAQCQVVADEVIQVLGDGFCLTRWKKTKRVQILFF